MKRLKYNTKMLYCILGIFLLTTLVQGYFTWRSINDELQNRKRIERNVEKDRIETLKLSVETIVNNSVPAFEQNLDDKQQISQLLLAMVRKNPDLLGAAVAFEPNHFGDSLHLYAPYAFREGNNIRILSLSYDYTSFEWYESAMKRDKRQWCSPYTDLDGTYALMSTYSVPLKDKDNEVVAVLTSDLPMSVLSHVDKIYEEVSLRSIILLLMQVFGILLIIIVGWRAMHDMKAIEMTRREQELASHDLKLASRIQGDICPQALPQHEHVALAASLEAAPEVSGDFYDYSLQDNHLFFCIGDVATRGLGAAMAMLVTRTVYRTAIRQQHLPSKVMELMNEALISINERQMYATLLVGELDLSSGILNYCNAGHLAPYLLSEGVSTQQELVPNVPLGISHWEFKEQHMLLKKGDMLFFYNDGIVELMNEKEGVFGEKRLMLHMKNGAVQGDNPEALLKRVRTALRLHMGVEGVPTDDLTMLSFRYQ